MSGEKWDEVPYYPLFLSLKGRGCLVVGGGAVGERKIGKLLECSAEVRLVAAELTPRLGEQCENGRVLWLGQCYRESFLEGSELVFAATSDTDLNRRIARDCEKRGIWCNMATDPGEGSFIVPATVQQGPLTIAVSTAGLSPALARRIRERLQEEFGPEWRFLLHLFGLLRSEIQAGRRSTEENQRFFRELSRLPLVDWIADGRNEQAYEAFGELTRDWLDSEKLSRIWTEAWKTSFSSLQRCSTAAEPSDT